MFKAKGIKLRPYILAVLSNLFFALGSMFFTHYARRFSSTWINAYKAVVATLCFSLAVLVTTGFHSLSLFNFSIFFVSGFVALGIGDIFLVKAFSRLGPARSLMIFSFHPLIVGIISFVGFGQSINTTKFLSILFFLSCLFIFSLERYKSAGHWEIKGLVFAIVGMSLDAIGVPITRYAFDLNPSISVFEGNLYRCIGAIVLFVILSRFKDIRFLTGLKELSKKSHLYVFLGAIFGTFIALALYLEAIKSAHLATVSAISVTGVIFASLLESIWERKRPSVYLLISFIFFGAGMYLLLGNNS